MNAPNLLLWSLILYVVGAVAALLLARAETLSIRVAGVAGMLGAAAGVAAALPVLLSAQTIAFSLAGPFPFAHLAIRIDPLAALMVFVISLLAFICSLYSLSYVREYEGRGAWSMGFFMNLFIASMVALVVVDNAFYFLVLFEMMSLASYFLVIFDQDKEAVSAGFLYFLIAHAGSVLIMAAFFILYAHSGSLDFDSFRQVQLSKPLASLVFLLAFFGFGAKAGIVPLHGWLPLAHPAAPSHASAMMSGVMIKIGVFGIIKVGIDLLGATEMWWGMLVLCFGMISSVLGVLYALAEHDIKRLLAYHSVENVGIILMGVGVGMIGVATHNALLTTVGLLAGLFHLLNHAVFKGLLFLGAGSIIYRTHTRDMDHLGGLAHRMPWTAGCFLVGSMAICALPPLNGFVSEWFTYQSLFALGAHGSSVLLQLAGPVGMVMLALTGALAAMCFVKVWGISFSGDARSVHAEEAHEASVPMVAAMVLLSCAAVLLGVYGGAVAQVMANVAASVADTAFTSVTGAGMSFPVDAHQAVLSVPLLTILLAATLLFPLLLAAIIGRSRRRERRFADAAWACGYEQESSMTMSSGGFTHSLRELFAPLYTLREVMSPARPSQRTVDWTVAATTRMEPLWDRVVVGNCVRGVQWLGDWIRCLQHGDFRVYCLYVVVTLVILLLVAI